MKEDLLVPFVTFLMTSSESSCRKISLIWWNSLHHSMYSPQARILPAVEMYGSYLEKAGDLCLDIAR